MALRIFLILSEARSAQSKDAPRCSHRFLAFAGAAFLLAGCGYQGTVSDAVVAPPARRDVVKVPASIAFVTNRDALDKLRIGSDTPECHFDVRVGDATNGAVRNELEADFTSVTPIDRPRADDTADFYALPSYAWAKGPGDGCFYLNYELLVQLVLVARQSHQRVSEYRASTLVSIKNGALGEEIDKSVHAALAAVTAKLGDDIAKDRRLETLAALGPVRDVAAGAGAATPSPYDTYMDAVVVVETKSAQGSGFFVSADGLIVSCAHVVGDDTSVTIKTRAGQTLAGTVLAVSKERDLSLVKVAGGGFPLLRTTPELSATAVGHEVVAIGTPHGLSWTVSKGIVSAIRAVRAARVIQTDASLGEGSSGGPIVDLATGRVVGVASFTQGTDANFAIAGDEVGKAFADKLPPS